MSHADEYLKSMNRHIDLEAKRTIEMIKKELEIIDGVPYEIHMEYVNEMPARVLRIVHYHKESLGKEDKLFAEAYVGRIKSFLRSKASDMHSLDGSFPEMMKSRLEDLARRV